MRDVPASAASSGSVHVWFGLRWINARAAPTKRITCSGEPTRLIRRNFVHVPAERLDKKCLRHLRQEDGATGTVRRRLGNQVPYRSFQPLAGRVATHVDLDHARKSGKKHAESAAVASEISANEICLFAAAAVAGRRQSTGKIPLDRRAAFPQLRRRAVGDRVRVALGDDDDVTCFQQQVGLALHARDRGPLGEQMKDDDVLAARGEHRRNILSARGDESPRRGKLRVKENGGVHPNSRQSFGKCVHDSLYR